LITPKLTPHDLWRPHAGLLFRQAIDCICFYTRDQTFLPITGVNQPRPRAMVMGANQ
jgi:hypothetical protein